MSEILPAAEAAELAECEHVIERGLKTFVEVGTALAVIRDGGLYRATHATFEAYCDDRWNISRPRAYELIGAAGVVSAMADTLAAADLPAPGNERQARELSNVPAGQRAEVWQRTLERTNGKPTAAALREAKAVMNAHYAEVAERREREARERQQDIEERLARDREACPDAGWQHGGWLHSESPILLSGKLQALAESVHRCAPSLRRNEGGQEGHTAAWGFGFYDWRSLDELERFAPAEAGQARADLEAAIAAYDDALGEAVKRAKAAVKRVETTLKAAADDAAGVVLGTQHHYRRPVASGWLAHSETVWHDQERVGADTDETLQGSNETAHAAGQTGPRIRHAVTHPAGPGAAFVAAGQTAQGGDESAQEAR